jgi:predicted polyphosphate/ATP-dependent NAD kinase
MVEQKSVGIIANPMSGRDIRRLVAHASVFPNIEKANMIERILAALGAVGIPDVLMSTDLGGISAAVLRGLTRRPRNAPAWPGVEFLSDTKPTDSAEDSVNAARAMSAAGVSVVICLGGDGTARAVASGLGDTPMLALSTGTNNAFPVLREATVAGACGGTARCRCCSRIRLRAPGQATRGRRGCCPRTCFGRCRSHPSAARRLARDLEDR